MNRICLLIYCLIVPAALQSQVDPIWQAYYDSTDSPWGTDWREAARLLENAKTYLEVETDNYSVDSSYSLTLNDLAICYDYLDRPKEALGLYQKSLQITQETVGRNHIDYARGLANIAGLQESIGQIHLILPNYLEAIKILEYNNLNKTPEYNTTLSNIANFYRKAGAFDEALKIQQKVVVYHDTAPKINYSTYVNHMDNLAMIHHQMGNYPQAIQFYEKAIEIALKHLKPHHPELGRAYNNLSWTYKEKREFEKALELSFIALKNAEVNYGKTHSQYSSRFRDLGDLYHDMGQYYDAIQSYDEALNILEDLGWQYQFKYGILQHRRAISLRAIGLDSLVVASIVEANENATKIIRQYLSSFNQKNKINVIDKHINIFDHYQSFGLETKYASDTLKKILYNNALFLKEIVINSTNRVLASTISDGDSIALNQIIELRKMNERLSSQISKPPNRRNINIDSLQDRIDRFEEKLVIQSKAYADLVQIVDWTDIRDALKDDEVAIEFMHFRYFGIEPTDSTMYVAMLINNKNNTPEIIPLFEENQLRNLYHSKNEDFSKNHFLDLYNLATDNLTQNDGGLYSLIWEKIDKHLNNTKTVYFSVSGDLHQISFAAIPHPDGGYLFQHYNLVQINSTRQIIHHEKNLSPESAALFGGIEYQYNIDSINKIGDNKYIAGNILPKERSSNINSFHPLEGTNKEVKRIGDFLRHQDIEVGVKIGKAATEAQFKSFSGNSPNILHIATHGFFFDDPDSEAIEDASTFSYLDDPMYRAGLAFSGANYTWDMGYNPYEKEDGILTAFEISNLDLSNTDLVILSACKTGLGEIKGSEGVYGLQRAFKLAGVNNIIMSLWEVSDEETQELMETFYSYWLKGYDIRSSFQKTQLEMSKKYPPEDWAGFVLVGDIMETSKPSKNQYLLVRGRNWLDFDQYLWLPPYFS